MSQTIHLHYDVPGDDFTRAGEASGMVKNRLKKLGFPSDAVRRVAIAMYEGEINMVIHADGGRAEVEIAMDHIIIRMIDSGPGIPDVDQAIAEKFPDLMTPEQLAVARSHDGPTPEQPKVPTPEEKALTAREEAELAQRRDWAEEMNAVEDRVQKPVLREQLAETSRDFGPADELDRETLPDGYESITEENARQRGPEPAPTGREPREQERPARGRSDDHRQPERSEGRGRGDAPRRTELDSREQSKATIRDKISAVADRLQRTAGRDAPTQVLGLDAHRKGPTR